MLLGSLGLAEAQTTATVTVNAGSAIATIAAGDVGVNMPIYDNNMLDNQVKTLLANAGFALRFPGGTYSDLYNWQTQQIVQNQSVSVSTNNNFDAFMGIVKATGATPILTVNYGTDPTGTTGGSTSLAAAWVQYSNVTKGYGVKYWEIGNEVYGNGFYGADWEPDLHSGKDPTTYGTNVVAFSKAMKAIDPTIKIGAVLTAPGNWPDGQTPSWNNNALAQCINNIDFVILHWYPQGPGGETDAGLLSSPTSGTYSIPNMMATIRSLLTQYGGANASKIQVLVTETNSVYADPGKQTTSVVNGMFIADSALTWIENGATNMDVWDLHNSSYTQGNNASTLYGSNNYGDFGILSNATSGEPALDTPFPAYYGMKMAALTGQGGDTLVSTTSSNSLLTTHAVKQAGGNLALMLINKDPSNATTATVSVAGYTPAATGTTYLYGSGNSTIKSSTLSNTGGGSFTVSVPFYSIATVVLTPAATTTPAYTLSASPTSLSLVQGASGTATVTVAPTGGFTGSVAFAISGVPSGVTASFSPASSTGSSVLTLATTSAAAVGTSVMTITGTSGALSATTTVGLTVTAKPVPSYNLSASPSSLSVVQGASGTSTITIAPSGGFTGTVALAASGLPSGVTASFSPASATTSSTLTLTASSTATAGTGSVTITGTSGTLSKTVTLPLTVTAAATGGGGGTPSGAGPATFSGVASSNSAWFDEDDVDVKAPGTITALTVTVTVPATNVTYGSIYSTIGSQIVTSHVTSGGNIVYTFTLTAGQTIGAGSYTFASQMSGNGTTHNPATDSWTVTYTAGGQTYSQSGVF